MVCIYCHEETQVVNSRLLKRSDQVWRRRKCISCRNVFSTSEEVDWEQAIRYKRKNRLESFSRDKLYLSVYEACRHRKTAVSDATGLTATILSRLWPHIMDATLTREQVIGTATEVLKRFDRAAAVQYTAYHPVNN